MKTLLLCFLLFLAPCFAGVTGTNTTYVSGSFTALNGTTKATMACWIRRDSAGTFQQIGPSDMTSANKFIFDWFSDNVMYFEAGNGNNRYGFVSANLTGWHHFAMVYDGSQATNEAKLTAYINGTPQTLSYFSTLPTSLPASGLTMYVNRSVWATGAGGYAECGIWNDTLTAAEVASLAKGFSPDQIRPSKLVLYMPLVRETGDLKGTPMTNSGMTAAAHPSIRQ